jgi:hypothetical protein
MVKCWYFSKKASYAYFLGFAQKTFKHRPSARCCGLMWACGRAKSQPHFNPLKNKFRQNPSQILSKHPRTVSTLALTVKGRR